MRSFGIFAVAAATAALVSVWLVNDGIASNDTEADKSSPGQAGTASPAAEMSNGLFMPSYNPSRGRMLFASKGCMVCHSINGVGGEDATPLDAATMPRPMNPFEFSARMWRGAGAMIFLQEDELGYQIELTGEELADIIAFVHDEEEQKKFSIEDAPAAMRELLAHGDDEGEDHEGEDDEKHDAN